MLESPTIKDPTGVLLRAVKRVSRKADRTRLVRNCRGTFGVPASLSWPLSYAVAFLEGAGYDCDERYLARLIEDGVTSPAQNDYGLAFSDEQVGELLFALHDRRRWLPGRFMDCKNPAEIARDERTAASCVDMFDYLAGLDPQELGRRVANATEPRLRKLFFAAIRLQAVHNAALQKPSEAEDSESTDAPDLIESATA